MKPAQLYTPKVLNTVKVLLLLGTFGFIFYKLVYAYHIKGLIKTFSFSFTTQKVSLLLAVVVLMLVNWLTEAAKWRLLISRHEPVSIGRAVQAVVSGVALSIITPNQLGDFAGRILHLRKLDKIRGTLVAVVGNTAQVVMTIAFGMFAFIWLLHYNGQFSDHLASVLYIISTVLAMGGLVGYLHIDLVQLIPFVPRIKSYLTVFGEYSRAELSRVLLFALVRYTIFVGQYMILLHVFGIELPFVAAASCVAATLFASAFVPSFLLVEVGMRGASALFFFSFFTDQSAGILLSSYTLWVVNLMFPALAGLVVILKLKAQ